MKYQTFDVAQNNRTTRNRIKMLHQNVLPVRLCAENFFSYNGGTNIYVAHISRTPLRERRRHCHLCQFWLVCEQYVHKTDCGLVYKSLNGLLY